MKKLLVISVFVFSLFTSSLALAAPLDDANKAGNASISIYGLYSKNKLSFPDIDTDATADNTLNIGFSADVAVAPKIILSVDYLKDQSDWNMASHWDDATSYDNGFENKLTSTAIKIKYQAYKDKNLFFAPYIGFARNKANLRGGFYDTDNQNADGSDVWSNYAANSKSKTSILAGFTLVGNLDRDGRFKAYLDGAVGNKMWSGNVGLSIAATKNFAIDLGYRYLRAKGLDTFHYTNEQGFAGMNGAYMGKTKATSKGFYLGLTLNFN